MKIHIVTVGSPKLPFAKEGFSEYTKRLSGFADVYISHIKEGKDQDKKILKSIEKSFCVLLDENGKQSSSEQLSQFFVDKEMQAVTYISFVIGGPDGHSGKIKERADYVWSLSDLTFPHDVAMLLLAEALYRAFSIKNNHPYHRS